MTNLAARVAADLREIGAMAQRLEERAIDRSNAREMPGGDALVSLASVGSIAVWQQRIDLAEAANGNGSVDLSHEDPDELWPAVQVLWFWSEAIRLELNMDYDDPRWRPTLVSEAAFLRNADVAEWIWAHEVHFEDYAADVARAKSKLENILHEGERSERTAVVCDRCDAGRPLIRVYADPVPIEWSCARCEWLVSLDSEDEHCPRCWSSSPPQPVMHSDPINDRWKCPSCKHRHDWLELEDARATQMRRSEPRQWIPRTQAVALLRSLGHQERVATRLVDHPDTEGWRDETTHVRWVSWPEAWRRHLSEMQRRRMTAARSA